MEIPSVDVSLVAFLQAKGLVVESKMIGASGVSAGDAWNAILSCMMEASMSPFGKNKS